VPVSAEPQATLALSRTSCWRPCPARSSICWPSISSRWRLALGDMLYEPNQQMHHAIFPTTAVVSLHYVTINGLRPKSPVLGMKGVVGIALFMGGDTTPSSAVVQTAAKPIAWIAILFEAAFERPGVMQGLLLRYAQALMTQVSQTAPVTVTIR